MLAGGTSRSPSIGRCLIDDFDPGQAQVGDSHAGTLDVDGGTCISIQPYDGSTLVYMDIDYPSSDPGVVLNASGASGIVAVDDGGTWAGAIAAAAVFLEERSWKTLRSFPSSASCEVISIRPATIADYGFIDRLQDMHTKMLGFMPKSQLEGKITAGHVLIAEDDKRAAADWVRACRRISILNCDDVGIIYQLNISPGKQRSLVGA